MAGTSARWLERWRLNLDAAAARIRRDRGADSVSRSFVRASALENRLLFSATPIEPTVESVDGAEMALMQTQTLHTATATADVLTTQQTGTSQTTPTAIVFVDALVADYQAILDDLAANQPDAQVIVIGAQEDGIATITNVLDQAADVDAVHIISHGTESGLYLGTTFLDSSALDGYAGDIASWGSALTTDADILIYGCDLAATADGQTLLQSIAALTDADVAASDDDTGHERYAADWELEYAIGTIDTEIAVSEALQETWMGKLAVIEVNTFADETDSNGMTSLREAVLLVNAGSGGDTILLASGTYILDLDVPGDNDLRIEQDATVVGQGADATIIDASGLNDRIFQVSNGATLTIEDMHLRGGTSDSGGLVRVDNAATLHAYDIFFEDGESTAQGGAVYSKGTLHLERASFFDNEATSQGGAIFLENSMATLTNVTISGNTAPNGGGLYALNANATLTHVTIADNSSGIHASGSTTVSLRNSILSNNGANANTNLASLGHNIDSDGTAGLAGTGDLVTDPLLTRLGDIGGGIPTHGLAPYSPAIDAGLNAGAPAEDGRGYLRDDGAVDIGAVEMAWDTELWIGTTEDVPSPSGVHGTDSWHEGEALGFGDPNFALGSGTNEGELRGRFDINLFADDGDANLDGIHFVSREITVGSTNAVTLQVGDILFATQGETFEGGTVTSSGDDVMLFRPDVVGDYSSGTVSVFMDDITSGDVMGLTLIEQDTFVGDTLLEAGDLLYSTFVPFLTDNIYLYEVDDVGIGTTSGTQTEFVSGGDIGLGLDIVLGVDLVESEIEVGGVTLSAGTLLLQSTGNNTVGSNSLATTEDDIFALTLTETQIGSGNTEATAEMLLRGSDLGLDSTPGSLDGFSLTFHPTNLSPTDIGLSNTSIDENRDSSGGLVVGQLSASDPDTNETFTYSIVGGVDQAVFSINGSDQLVITDGVIDYETQTSYAVRLEVSDSYENTFEKDIVIDVNNLNDAPEISLSTVVSSLAENASTASATTVATITIQDDSLGTESVTLSGADASLFEVVGTDLRLRSGVSLDFESNDSLDVTVSVNDSSVGGDPDDSEAFSLAITDINEAPSLSLTTIINAVAENADTSSALTVATINVDDDALGSETLSLSGSDAAQFEIVGTDLRLRSGATLDFEDDDSLDVSVSVDDVTVGSTPDDTQAFSLTVTDVNEAPSITLTTVVGTLAENTDTSSAITVATITIDDDALGSETLSLSGSDAAAFEIVGTDVRLRAGAILDFEDDDSLDVSVNVDDATVGSTPDDTRAFSLTVTDVNEAPSITITTVVGSLAENADTSSAITVATITVDDDALGSETLSLSGSDAAVFEIVGNDLRLRSGATLDFEDDDSLDVSVSVDDVTVGSTPDDTQAFSLSITDVNEAPSLTITTEVGTLSENLDTSSAITVATITIDDDALGSETLSLSGSDAAQFEIVGTDLRLRSGVTLDFEDDDSLDVSVSVDDATVGATPDDTQAFSLSVTDANDAPSITLTTVVGSLAENADTSSAITVATIMVVDDGLGSETLSLSGSDAAAFEIVGNDLRLRSGATLDFEDDDSLDVSVSVDDVTVGSTPDDTQAFSLSVTDVNEAPTITITTVVGTLAENADTSSAITVATIAIGDDALGSETLSLSGSDAASFELVGNQLRVRAGATLDFEDDDSLDVSVSVDDPTVGSTPDDTQAFSVSVTDVNEAPSITLTPVQTTLGEDEDTSASIVVATLSIHDDALGSESLTLSGFDASLFEIDGNRLQLRAGTVLDATLNSSLDVTVNVDDATVGGTPDDSEAFTVTVTQGNSDPTGQPQIVGTLRVGETLQAETGSIQDADGLGAFDYQWQRDGVDIVGANQHDYTLTDADEDAQIQVAIRFIDGRGTSEGPLISLASDAVAGRLVLPPPATNAGADSGGETQSETTESNESSSSSEDSSSSESSEESGESDSGDSESAGEASDSNLAAKVVKQELGQRLNPSGSEAETGQLDVEAVVTADPIQQEWQRVAGSSAQADSTWQSIQRATTVVSQVSNLLDLNVAIDLTRVLSPQEVAMFVEPGKLWNALDQNQQVIQDTIRGDLVVVGTAGAAASSLTVGAVAWTLRSGVLLSGFLAQLPAWRAVDPLLVMQGLSSNGADNETLEELMQRRNEGFGHDETHDSSSDEIASLTTESDVDTRSRETNPEGFETKAQL